MVTDTQTDLDLWLRDARKRVSATTFAPSTEQVGRVKAVADGIARVSGLPNVRLK
jgi:F-type H+/Na+-transporting ATPase subunit alpha